MKIEINNYIIDTKDIYMITPIKNADDYWFFEFEICFFNNLPSLNIRLYTKCYYKQNKSMNNYIVKQNDSSSTFLTFEAAKNAIESCNYYKTTHDKIQKIREDIIIIWNNRKNNHIPSFSADECYRKKL